VSTALCFFRDCQKLPATHKYTQLLVQVSSDYQYKNVPDNSQTSVRKVAGNAASPAIHNAISRDPPENRKVETQLPPPFWQTAHVSGWALWNFILFGYYCNNFFS